MKTVGSFEAKTHLSKLLEDVVHRHEAIVIQKRGVNVAVLLPFDQYARRQNRDVLQGFRDVRAAYGGGKPVHDDPKEMIRRDRKR